MQTVISANRHLEKKTRQKDHWETPKKPVNNDRSSEFRTRKRDNFIEHLWNLTDASSGTGWLHLWESYAWSSGPTSLVKSWADLLPTKTKRRRFRPFCFSSEGVVPWSQEETKRLDFKCVGFMKEQNQIVLPEQHWQRNRSQVLNLASTSLRSMPPILQWQR